MQFFNNATTLKSLFFKLSYEDLLILITLKDSSLLRSAVCCIDLPIFLYFKLSSTTNFFIWSACYIIHEYRACSVLGTFMSTGQCVWYIHEYSSVCLVHSWVQGCVIGTVLQSWVQDCVFGTVMNTGLCVWYIHEYRAVYLVHSWV